MEKAYTCPCCGFPNLTARPYKNIPEEIEKTRHQPTPYENIWGMPSYEVCSCCGFEFGNDDQPWAGVAGTTFEKALEEWIDEGCNWISPDERPSGWSLDAQLAAAGISRLS